MADVAKSENVEIQCDIDSAVFASRDQAEDINFVRNQGFRNDDSNKPAPENIHPPN